MKTPFLHTALRHGLLLLLLAGALHALPGAAQTPQFMTYQGYLTDQNGTPYATNGPQAYDIVFRIWPTATGGSIPLYGELQTVTVANGYFSVLLGQGNPYVNNSLTDPRPPLTAVFTNNVGGATNRYVEMTVKGLANGQDVVILPRLQLVTAPYAFLAANANALVSPTTGNTLLSSSGTNLTINGSLTANSIIGNLTLLLGSFYMDNAQTINAKNAAGNYENFLWPRWTDNITYLNFGSAGFNIRNNNSASVMWMSPGGAVGIGTTGPGYTLDVNGSFHANSANITGSSTLSGGYTYLNTSADNSAGNVGVGFGGYSDVKLAINTSEAFGLYIDSGATYEAAFLGGNSEVDGVLTVDDNGTFENSVVVNGSSSPYLGVVNDYGFEFDLGVAQGNGNWSSSAAEGDTVLRSLYSKLLLQSGSGSAAITITTGNLVGIGTSTPSVAQVEIRNRGQATSVSNYGYLNSGGASHISGSSGGFYCSLFADSRIECPEFDAFSDARIKSIKGHSDSRQDLQTLQGIEVTDYTMVDTVAQGNRPFKKVIGQQLEKVYAQAVSRSTNVVPDIFANSVAKAGWIPLSKHLDTALAVGDQVRLITAQDTALHEVTEVKPDGFRTKDAVDGAVFVYGRQVNDFRTVDYDAIAMLNVSATQELAKRLEKVEARESHLADLEQKAAQVATLENEVADLKKLVTQLAAASKHTKLAADSTPSRPSADGEASSSKRMTTASLNH